MNETAKIYILNTLSRCVIIGWKFTSLLGVFKIEQNKQMKNIRSKITDYTSFGYILLVLSVFLYIGIIIPEERSVFQIYTMMGTTLIFLSVSFTFFVLAIKYKKQIEES